MQLFFVQDKLPFKKATYQYFLKGKVSGQLSSSSLLNFQPSNSIFQVMAHRYCIWEPLELI